MSDKISPKNVMQQETVLQALAAHKQELAARYGITRLGIFGSLARGQASAASDIDIVVAMPPDLFQMVHAKEYLERLLNAPVDLIRLHNHLPTLLQSRINNDVIYV